MGHAHGFALSTHAMHGDLAHGVERQERRLQIVLAMVSGFLHQHAPPRAGLMLIVATAALVVNGLSVWLLQGAVVAAILLCGSPRSGFVVEYVTVQVEVGDHLCDGCKAPRGGP